MAANKPLPLAVLHNNRDILDLNDNEKEKLCKKLLTQAQAKLISDVFSVRTTNVSLVQYFISSSYIGRNEAERILNPFAAGFNLTNQEWSLEFCNLILNNFHIAECLSLLCNLDEGLFASYRNKIHRIFNDMEGVQIIERKNLCQNPSNPSLLPVTPQNSETLEEDCDMLEKHNAWVDKHINKLEEYTMLNSKVLAIMMSQGVIDRNEKGTLEGITNPNDKVSKFYDILRIKEGYFDKLIQALGEARQTMAKKILEGFYKQ